MITVKRYEARDKEVWDRFVRASKNHLFMFERDYMDYHRDRFFDHSLMFYREDELSAVLPACEKDCVLFSHAGLTYGGFITNEKMKQHIMNECFEELIHYSRQNNIQSIQYKCIPHIYHNQPAEEDRYALYVSHASVMTVDASTYVNLEHPLKMPKGRRAQISRAGRENVDVRELQDIQDFECFMELENQVLRLRHDTKAVHTAAELKRLRDFFPGNIHLFGAFRGEKWIAGVVLYEYDKVIHTQYMAADEEARKIGALDLIIWYIIEKYRETKKWLDFGISTEHGRIYLNEGLIAQKESFGGRTGVYEIWKLEIEKCR